MIFKFALGLGLAGVVKAEAHYTWETVSGALGCPAINTCVGMDGDLSAHGCDPVANDCYGGQCCWNTLEEAKANCGPWDACLSFWGPGNEHGHNGKYYARGEGFTGPLDGYGDEAMGYIKTASPLIKLPGVGCEGSMRLGAGGDFDSPESCLAAALENPACGNAIQFSEGYNYAWGCYCCPAEIVGFGENENWDTYFNGPLAKEPAKGCGTQAMNLGTEFDSPESCMAEALQTAECGHAVMFSESYNYAWGCRCCADEPQDFGDHENELWDSYVLATCARPPATETYTGWCSHEGSKYEYKDCDADGIPDHVCTDSAGSFGIIASGDSCVDTWPNGGVCQTAAPEETASPTPAETQAEVVEWSVVRSARGHINPRIATFCGLSTDTFHVDENIVSPHCIQHDAGAGWSLFNQDNVMVAGNYWCTEQITEDEINIEASYEASDCMLDDRRREEMEAPAVDDCGFDKISRDRKLCWRSTANTTCMHDGCVYTCSPVTFRNIETYQWKNLDDECADRRLESGLLKRLNVETSDE